ncbi:ABC-2 transporter permease [Marinisporobacter balticus]|uniref:ABC-2 family transporter n=1 Tax=Marinisporobacter balticus TaxID=2018667 RepID=A0A4R2L5W2_9FIRM|nr:ABC-2 transporter permease [Marinisporobacter balticus]TCO78028.1 ABC-2 family transporter [Marinisporobacter balticus]
MFHLIVKELRIQKRSFLLALFYPIFAIYVFGKPEFSESIYIMIAVAISYIFALTALAYDEKNNSDVLLLSLPIKKRHIVIAKYLSIFVFCIIGIVISGGMGAILHLSGYFSDLRFINFIDMIAVFTSMGILMALYYPFYFKFGANHIRLLNICFFMLVFFAPSTLLKLLLKNDSSPFMQQLIKVITHMSSKVFGLFMFIIVMIIMAISLLISLKIYEHKDF